MQRHTIDHTLTFTHWLLIYILLTAARAEFRSSRQIFSYKFCKFHRKTPVLDLFFTTLQAFRPATLLKIDIFTGNFLLKNIWMTAFVYWWYLNNCFCVLITSACIDFYNSLQHMFFSFTDNFCKAEKLTSDYCAIKTIELMTREVVSFEEVFHWTKFLAFESWILFSMKYFMKA